MCIEKLVSLQDCYNDEPAPVTGLYLDTHTGITPEELDQIILTPYATGLDLFKAKRQASWELVQLDVVNKLRPIMKADSITENLTVGYINGTETAAIPGYWVGTKLEINNPRSFMDLLLSNINILLPSITAETEVRIYDLDTKQLIQSFTIVPNQRTYKGIKIYNPKAVKKIAIVYESTEISTRTIVGANCGTCGGGYKMIGVDQFVKASGVKLTVDAITGNVLTEELSAVTYGMIIDYSLSCSRQGFLCSIGNDVALPVLYRTGAEIMKYAIDNAKVKRVNNIVDTPERLQARFDTYMIAYSEQISSVLQNIRIPNDPDCFNCKKNNKYIPFAI